MRTRGTLPTSALQRVGQASGGPSPQASPQASPSLGIRQDASGSVIAENSAVRHSSGHIVVHEDDDDDDIIEVYSAEKAAVTPAVCTLADESRRTTPSPQMVLADWVVRKDSMGRKPTFLVGESGIPALTVAHPSSAVAAHVNARVSAKPTAAIPELSPVSGSLSNAVPVSITTADARDGHSTTAAAAVQELTPAAPLARIVASASADAACTGAVMLAVVRGKAAEGLDFADHYARAVVLVGIPYANVAEPTVELKRTYQDNRAREDSRARAANAVSAAPSAMTRAMPGTQHTSPAQGNVINGSEWYRQQAFRALNQSLGRVIRHRRDYGAVILLDERFGWAPSRAALSQWARDSVRNGVPLSTAVSELRAFFGALAEQPPM